MRTKKNCSQAGAITGIRIYAAMSGRAARLTDAVLQERDLLPLAVEKDVIIQSNVHLYFFYMVLYLHLHIICILITVTN